MPNPWALVILVIGGALIITGFKGSQDNLIAAVLGRPYKNSTLGAPATGTSATPSAYDPTVAGSNIKKTIST